MQWALTTGDPLADRVARRIAEGDEALARSLKLGLREGLAAIPSPDRDLTALLEDLEQAAGEVDDDLLRDGAEAFWTMPPAVHVISLSVGSLIRVYESPSIAAVLSGTGRLVEGADARLRETAKWLGEAMLPDALRPGARGYIATVGVRMLHAKVRHYALMGDYDAARHGVPINQIDLARTWMDFTLTSWNAEAELGYDLTARELDRAYRLWEYIGRLLGIDGRLVGGITTHEAAQRADATFQAVTGPLSDQSATLAHATIDSVADQLHEIMSLPVPVGQQLLRNLTHRFHGRAMAKALTVAPAPMATPFVAGAKAAIRLNRKRMRRRPDVWKNMIDRNVRQLGRQLSRPAEPAEYEIRS